MDLVSSVRNTLTDGRFDANLIAFYTAIVLTVLASLVLRRLLAHGSTGLARRTGLHWLDAVGEEAARRLRSLLLWLTVAVVVVTAVTGLGYHLAGRDVRQDLIGWYERLTPDRLVVFALQAGALVGIVLAARFGVWLIRRLLPYLEGHVLAGLGHATNDEHWGRWFRLLERFAVTAVRLVAIGAAGQLVGLGDVTSPAVGFLLRVITIVAVARLLTLACRALSRTLADLGDRHLRQGAFQRYWERVTRLVPFGERCFEAAVTITATSLCVGELHFIAFVADFGPKIVQCIGILFSTRVLIELLQVLLNEAFGLYDEAEAVDQKGRTLVPLLQSVCQYVLYLGSAVVMLGVIGIDTRPILAGAGILGLAVGLGAQNLVTDVVSGFFILFENQYLVGDYVEIGHAAGVVEAVGIRLTQVRDGHGKLTIIPNGQIKGVVNYSKGYVNAVVDVTVPSGSDLEGLFRAMTEAGRLLRKARKEVLADTVVQGLVAWGTSDMTVRAVTKVQPGAHGAMENEYRRLLRQVLEEQKAAPASRAA